MQIDCNTTFYNTQLFCEAHDHIFKQVFKSENILLFKKATIKKIKGCYDCMQSQKKVTLL